MGDKISKDNDSIAWYRERRVNSLFVYNVSMFCLRFIPRSISHFLGYIIAFIVYILHRTERLNLRFNLSILLKRKESSPQVRLAVYRVVKNFINSQIDLLKCFNDDPGNYRFTKSIISIARNDLNPIDELISIGRGLIMITGHIGLWELGGIILSIYGYPVTVITYRDRKEVLEKKNTMRSRMNIRTVTLGEGHFGSLNIARELRSGSIIALLIDRPITKNQISFDFMGHSSDISTDFFLLSRLSGSPVLPTFIVFDSSQRRYRAIFGKPFISYGGKNNPADKHDKEKELYTDHIINLYKKTILEYYDQWYNFYPFFKEH